MARTRSSYIPVGVASRGFAVIEPDGGEARASRGYVVGSPEQGVLPAAEVLDPEPLLSTETVDSNGTQRLLDNEIQALFFWEAGQDVFANPDKEFTGYAANGFWHTNGVPDPTHVPFQATWAAESDSVNRGVRGSFPPRLLVVATRLEVALFDADSLDLWMRFEIGTSAATGGKGKAMGNSIAIRDVAYANGVLVAATSQDVRVVEFAWDRASALGEVGSLWRSDAALSTPQGIVNRNNDDYLNTGPAAGADVAVTGSEFFCVAMRPYSYGKDLGDPNLRGALTVAVVGSDRGLTAITFGADWRTERSPITHRHTAQLAVGATWVVLDDGDGYSPYIGDGVTDWEAKNVYPGDKFFGDVSSSVVDGVVVEVDQISPGNRLVMDREYNVSLTDTAYVIRRDFGAVYLTPDMTLYVANGPNAIARNASKDWFWTESGTTPQNLFTPDPTVSLTWRGDVSRTRARSFRANDMARRGDVTFLATDIGVQSVSDVDLDELRLAAFTYSTQAATEYTADFRILEGTDTNVSAVVVDPETGNISVAVTDVESVVTEINPNIEQAFRYFDQVGRVRALVTFRNPLGPPDREVS